MTLVTWLILVALVVTALGWIKDSWFFSVGYAACVILMLAATVAVTTPGPASIAQITLLALWGVRMFWFLTSREKRSSYAQRPDATREPISYARRVPIWIMCALLYPAMVAPTVAAAQMPGPAGGQWIATWIGLILMTAGLVIETVADFQKQRAKSRAPKANVRTGLFSWVRCPNYLGEATLWIGNLVAGTYGLRTPLAWVVAVLGTAALVFIMLGATRRLERTQMERYGHDPEFVAYTQTVPVLVPWVPVYSIRSLPVPEL